MPERTSVPGHWTLALECQEHLASALAQAALSGDTCPGTVLLPAQR